MLPDPYLSTSLIAYIGNKRSLLPFLRAEFERCAADLPPSGTPPLFLDPFAGSGGVSRLGRSLGFRVGSADLEYYAALIGRCRVVLDPGRLEAAFAEEGGSSRAFAALAAFALGAPPLQAASALPAGAARGRWLDAFEAAAAAEPYLARHYAPRTTEGADWRSERLFYTAENARALDRAREAVERLFPEDPLASGDSGDRPGADSERAADAKAALVDAILYQAATRANTSGVFKACHRGFGGHGADALGRILSPVVLAPPVLVDGPSAESAVADAAAFCAARPADIVYLDPPYNQHQYGSNYHLLTSVARWDKPPVPDRADATGFLLDRSGIRPDWTATRSGFCRRASAPAAFSALLDAIDARFVLLSYNDGGILSLDDLAGLLSARGKLRVEARDYVAYRGGKQSASRLQGTSELLFVLDTRGSSGRRGSAGSLRLISKRGRAAALLRGCFHPGRARALLPAPPADGFPFGLEVRPDGGARLAGPPLDAASEAELDLLLERLDDCACADGAEAFDVALAGYGMAAGKREAAACARAALGALRKLAFRKYAADYAPRSAAFRAALRASPSLTAKLDELDRRASLRGAAVGPGPDPYLAASENTAAVKVSSRAPLSR